MTEKESIGDPMSLGTVATLPTELREWLGSMPLTDAAMTDYERGQAVLAYIVALETRVHELEEQIDDERGERREYAR